LYRRNSFSNGKGVLRGLHCSPYGKLVQCVAGSIVDYFVDLREDSPTYLSWKSVELSAEVPLQVYIPAKCGHGIFSKEDNSILVYLQEGYHQKDFEMNVNPFDLECAIRWPVCDDEYIISDQDKNSPSLKEAQRLYSERIKAQ